MTLPYKITYTPAFAVFWGLSFAIAIFTNGLLSVAFVALALLTLIHHEHAHVKECLTLGVKVNAIEFNWLGGLVNMDCNDARDARNILLAGVLNTAWYAVACNALLGWIYLSKPIGLNFANNPYLELLSSCAMFTGLFVLVNVLPFSFKSKKHGLITTDGYGAILMNRLAKVHDELWNDGARVALDQQGISGAN